MQKHLNKLFYSSLVIIAFMIVLLILQAKKGFYPDEQIQSISKQYSGYFETNAENVESSLLDLKKSLDTIDLASLEHSGLVTLLTNKLDKSDPIIAFLVIEHGKKMTMLEKDQETFLVAIDSSENTDIVVWQRINKDLEVQNTWTRALGVELNVLNWGEEVFNDSYKYKIPIWTSAGRLMENARNTVATHITWESSKNQELLTCIAIIDQFSELALLPQTTGLQIQSFIENVNDQIFPFFGTNGADSLSLKFNKKAIESWEITGKQTPSTFNFSATGENYWGQSLATKIRGINSLVFVLEEDALRLSILSNNWTEISIIVVFVIIAIVLFLLMRKGGASDLQKYIDSQNTDKHASELIKLGENNHLEFKSSFRYDYKQEKVNKDLEYVIAKSIAAFSNGRGGTLLIGVDDEGQVLGLEKDIMTFKRKDIDFFENFLRTFLNKMFSISFVSNNIKMKFPVVDQKIICRIDVEAGKSPVFVEVVKNNNKTERFYVRSGNTSMEMTTLSEINKYIQDRF